MKSVRTYLIVVFSLLCIALGFGIYIWYSVQKYEQAISNPKSIESDVHVPIPDQNPEA